MKVQFIVKRESSNEATFAVLSATINRQAEEHGLCSKTPFMDALSACVTQWVKDWPEGTAAYNESSQDFNVGDLANVLYEDSLMRIINDVGIFDLSIDVWSSEDVSEAWNFDRHLVDATIARELAKGN